MGRRPAGQGGGTKKQDCGGRQEELAIHGRTALRGHREAGHVGSETLDPRGLSAMCLAR